MASQKSKNKSKRFTGAVKTVPGSIIFPEAEKKATSAARHKPHEIIVKKNSQPVPVIRPPLPVIKKTVPLSTPSRHAWAPPKLPFAREIPSLYNETYLRMIPRGPHHIFSFWEIGGEMLEKVKEISGGRAGEPDMKPVLRLYAVGPKQGKKAGPPMHRVGDISVPPGIHSHYIRVPESGLTYRIDLGVMTASGRFITLCQSNNAATPRARVQKATDTGNDNGRRPGDSGGIGTQKLIDFSLLSGKMIEEAGPGQGLLFMDQDEPLAVEPGSDTTPGQGATVSSWGFSFPAPLAGTSAP